MDRSEAKKHLLEQYEKSLIADKARLVRKYDKLSQDEIDKRANYVLAQAVTRYAGDFANEKLINHISIPSDEHKGRIIGKEGRNIKTLEQILGVDIVIDDTPGVIVVSGFNLYRRAIATQTLKLLIDGGIINPVKIEETYDKVRQDFEQKILEDGKNIVLDLGLYPMHDEIMRLIGRLRYRASYGQNALAHSLEVAKLASVMAVEMGGDEKLALRAGLLHDIGKALTQDFGGSHVTLGADICKRHKEHPTVINAIYAHHRFEGIEPDGVESASVCAADALSAARPGARREVVESFTKRVKEIEAIALSRVQVKDAYAMSSGRELRVIVDAHKISDDEMTLLLKGITKEIEENVEFPGEIKISLIREKREISYAR
jgi:ribonuclease Y